MGGAMARVLITGSSDGLGLMAAQLLVEDGHAVTLHARNEQRGADARRALPAAEHVVIGDVQSIAGMRQVADEARRAVELPDGVGEHPDAGPGEGPTGGPPEHGVVLVRVVLGRDQHLRGPTPGHHLGDGAHERFFVVSWNHGS